MKKLFMFSVCIFAAATLSAKVQLPALLQDNMVLQQQTEANLWGKADPQKKVTVTTSWDKEKYTTQADENGAWKVAVSTPAAGGPYSITISDGDKIELNNVMIGEVWICSGQSNMQMQVAGLSGQPVTGSNEAILEGAQDKNIRMFTVKREMSQTPLDDCHTDTGWREASTQSIAEFSATGYFFGKNLYDVLNVPIGLIEADWGGTCIEAWMSDESAKKIQPDQTRDIKRWGAANQTACLFNAMVHPLINYTAKGFIWYQGETNLLMQNTPYYSQLMQEMVSLWRDLWGNDSMPFYFVQIAPYEYWGTDQIDVPLIVEQQLDATDKIPYSGIASTTDIGNKSCIHPPYKPTVGKRLALLALKETYKQGGIVAHSPRFKEARFENGKAYVTFTSDATLGPDYTGRILGFEIAGADKIFIPAHAEFVQGKQEIVVSSEIVAEPVAVRYAFRNVPKAAELYNCGGLPAFPFRTDSWDDAR